MKEAVAAETASAGWLRKQRFTAPSSQYSRCQFDPVAVHHGLHHVQQIGAKRFQTFYAVLRELTDGGSLVGNQAAPS
ncbi:hypothetical protein AB4Y42_12645 [Paraburkholderia sp. EG286B]|uniref:hypothetical protein n=1 Tax=Paraburkholderia sp. EG286B TaxID=3237011 RepID=UPI0034D16ECA